jgi:hypothetical protein
VEEETTGDDDRPAKRARVAKEEPHHQQQLVEVNHHHEIVLLTSREIVVREQHALVVRRESSLGVSGDHDHLGFPALVEMSPELIAALATLNDTVNTLSINMNQGFDSIDRQLANIEARQTNVLATEHGDPIRVITGPDGQNPPGGIFPNTYGQLRAMGPKACRRLLMFYGMPPNPSETRNQRLRKFLGAK